MEEYSIDQLRGVRPQLVTFDPQSVRPVTQEMLEFAQDVDVRGNNNIEKRRSRRHAVIAPVTAIELDEQLRPVATPFQTICRNLSRGGICLINDRAIQSDFLVVVLSAVGGVSIQTLAHIRRRRPLGPYHDIGTEFVTRLAKPNSNT